MIAVNHDPHVHGTHPDRVCRLDWPKFFPCQSRSSADGPPPRSRQPNYDSFPIRRRAAPWRQLVEALVIPEPNTARDR